MDGSVNKFLLSASLNEEDMQYDVEEDVTLEGSPLHQYLDGLDLADEENQSSDFYVESTDCGDINKSGFFCGASIKSYIISQWHLFRNRISTAFPQSEVALVDLSRHFYHKYGREITDSQIVFEEDLDFLCLEAPRLFLNVIRKQEVKKKTIRITRYKALALSFFTCLVSILLSPVVPDMLQAVFIAFSVAMCSFNIRLEVVIEIWKRRHVANLEALRGYIQSSHQLDQIIRKSVRFIHDTETVCNGYKLVNGATPISRIEAKNKARNCAKLRYSLFVTMCKCLLSGQNSISSIIGHLKSSSRGGSPSTSHFQQRLMTDSDEFIKLIENGDEEALYTITDGYSLSSLKSMNEMLRRQRSELLTCLSLCLGENKWDFSRDGFLNNFIVMLTKPLRTSVDCVDTLTCCFNMHKYITNEKGEQIKSEVKSDSKNTVFAMNFNSLQAHLRNALNLCIELDTSDVKNQDLYSSNLDLINHHVVTSQECLDVCYKEIGKITSNESSATEKNLQQTNTNVEPQNVSTAAVITTDLLHQIEDDQVFEAVVCEEDNPSGNEDPSGEDITDRIHKQESAVVIQELRSVLAVKTNDQQREVRKRKLFPSYWAGKPAVEQKPDNVKPVARKKSIKDDVELVLNDLIQRIMCDMDSSKSTDFQESSLIPGFKRCVPRNRRAPSHSARRRTSKQPKPTTGVDHTPGCDGDGVDNSTDNISDDNDKNSNWSDGIGIGFSASLAMQVAAMARKRQEPTGFELMSSENNDDIIS